MLIKEMSEMFDIWYSNITSNQAPGLNEHEKSVLLTRAEKEIVLNYFSPQSKGNNLQQGFDDSAKRQADFSILMKTDECTPIATLTGLKQIDDRSFVFSYPEDTFIIVNETIKVTETVGTVSKSRRLQVIPLRYDEYTRLMQKPYQRPLKHQAWRLINSGTVTDDEDVDPTASDFKGTTTKKVEIILNSWDEPKVSNPVRVLDYSVRYVRVPKPIILADLTADNLSIDGYSEMSESCELDPILHEAIVQRAVELGKIAWTATGQDNMAPVIQSGQRSE